MKILTAALLVLVSPLALLAEVEADPTTHITCAELDGYVAYVNWSGSTPFAIVLTQKESNKIVHTIEVTNKKQDLTNLSPDIISGSTLKSPSGLRYLFLKDADGDGLKDLWFLSSWGARGGQETYNIWLYNHEADAFEPTASTWHWSDQANAYQQMQK